MKNKIDFNEIMALVKRAYPDVSAFAFSETSQIMVPEEFQPIPDTQDESEIWKIKNERGENYLKSIGLDLREIDSYGGQGKGEEWWVVFHSPANDIYIKVEGFYESYNGTEFYHGWDSCTEVRPKEKTITVWE